MSETGGLQAQVHRYQAALEQILGMAREGCDAPSAAYRWCERIEEVAIFGASAEYAQYAEPLPDPEET
jgi:hypothetical protein